MFEIIVIAIFGALIGSFLTVCIHRIPLRYGYDLDEASIDFEHKLKERATIGINNPPRSRCPKCQKQLSWYHNIPIVSWLFLRGRCAFCKEKIPVRYPLVEILSTAAALASYHLYGMTSVALIVYVVAASLIVISFIDIDYFIIPDIISLSGTLLGVIVVGVNQYFQLFFYPVAPDIFSSCIGILAGGGFLYLVAEVYLKLRKKEGLGLGDVKLLMMVGAFFGPSCALFTIFMGSLLGSVIGIFFILIGAKRFSQEIPFGPYLALGTIVYLFGGKEVATLFAPGIGY